LAGRAVETPTVRTADELRSLDLALGQQRALMRTAPFVCANAVRASDEHDLLGGNRGSERLVRGDLVFARRAHPPRAHFFFAFSSNAATARFVATYFQESIKSPFITFGLALARRMPSEPLRVVHPPYEKKTSGSEDRSIFRRSGGATRTIASLPS